MNQNIVLIGMPGAGKSTIGVVLAKRLSMEFIDTDLLIQNRFTLSLQDIMDKFGYLELRNIEEREILLIEVVNCVIATGGSAVYSERAMRHLGENGTFFYLKNDFLELRRRISDFDSRGIAKNEEQSFEDVYKEREPLYLKHAKFIIDCRSKAHEQLADEIIGIFDNQKKMK